MEWVLCLGHALLGALLLPFASAGPRTRQRAMEVAAGAGTILGAGLVVAGAVEASGWRTVAFEPESAAPAGFAVACAWVLVAALGAEHGRVAEGALTGAAASGLVLAATGEFVVPALVFWLCSSLALAALAAVGGRGPRRVWPVLALSDAAVCAAAIAYVWREDAWTIPGAATGVVLWVLAGAAAIRASAHVVAPGSRLATAPLLAGGAVVLALRAGRAEPWLVLAILVAVGAALVVSLARAAVAPGLLATWPLGLALAACFVAPRHAPLAGAAGVLGVAAAALWPFTGTRAGFERALLVSVVPVTAGYAMVAAAATVAFERATEGAGSAIPWTIVAALFPAALAGGVVVGGRAARAHASRFVPEAVLATWLLLAVAFFVGLAPGALHGAGDPGGVLSLHLVALACGAGAALGVNRGRVPLGIPSVETTTLGLDAPAAFPRAAEIAAGAAAIATAGAAAWLTVSGLRVGFL
jgi:hypothetical protein